MKIEFMQKNYDAKDKLVELINKKVAKFEKYLDEGSSAKVVLSKNGSPERYKMEITLKGKNICVRSEIQSDNMYANLDTCLSKIERQLMRISGKAKDRIRNVDPLEMLFFDEYPEMKPSKIVKRKDFELDAMTEDDAVDQLELLGNDFYIYRDSKTGEVNVVYKRKDGNYGLIRTK